MHNVQKIGADLYYVGASDRRLALFESVYPIPRGVSYNSYLLTDDKTVLLDTVDRAVDKQFLENIEYVLNGRKLDFVIVNHMEPDHCATLGDLIRRYPDVIIVANAKIRAMINQFFDVDIENRFYQVAEGDTLCSGRHTLTFVMAPMVHWPEVMVTYDTTDKTLFSADAFGTFGALNGNIFADEVDFDSDWMSDARRYYTNIVGKYGNQVQALLKKASGLDIATICPLHGPIWRKGIGDFIEKYRLWSSYTPEENGVLIAYASVYGNTANAAEIVANELAVKGIRNIAMYDVSQTHASYIVAEAFRFSHIIFASTTYNAGIFVNMENLLHDIAAHNLQNRTVAFIENGSWAATSGGLMRNIISPLKNTTILENTVSIRSSVKDEQYGALAELADDVYESLSKSKAQPSAVSEASVKVDRSAMFKLSYGLFVLTAKDGAKDNGCIINTAVQITDNPQRISIAVNKANFTHDMIIKTGVFNLSVLTTDTPFNVFKHFGFQSGKDVDKFAGCETEDRTENGLRYVKKFSNAVISGKVIETRDCGTHTLFIADVTEASVLSDIPSVTYQYYFDHIKPKPQTDNTAKKGYVCKICGYVYEGDELPEDFICPLCKHGAEDFEKIG